MTRYTSAVGGGWRRGLFAAIGCTLGIVPHMLAAMLGLSRIMEAGSVAFEVVRWAGVAYLVFMGVSMIREAGAVSLDEGDADLCFDEQGVRNRYPDHDLPRPGNQVRRLASHQHLRAPEPRHVYHLHAYHSPYPAFAGGSFRCLRRSPDSFSRS